MRIQRLTIIIIGVLTGFLRVGAIPAYPKKIPIQVADETVYIQLYGDERHKWAETNEGYTIIQKSDRWYYAVKDFSGEIKASSFMLSTHPDDDTKQFLNSTPKHLKPDNKKIERNLSVATRKQDVQGTRRVLVILMEYKDVSLSKSIDDFNRLFNGRNYSEDGAQGSVYDYFNDVSYGQFQLISDVVGPFTSKNRRSYYGGNNQDGDDVHPEELFFEAINQAASQVSLKDYDEDEDGYVDNVHIIFAGHGEEAGASDEAIWSHEATFSQPYEIKGMYIDRYSCAPELRGNSGKGISRIGPHCHEIGHALGAMDYYDTNYTIGGNYTGTGDWDIMASGSWNNDGITPADFNPYVKAYNFGWIEPKALPSGDVTINPSCYDPESYYILQSDEADDFYLIENRSKDYWGKGIPGEGLLIFHIHPDIAASGNIINATAPQKCYIVCASSNKRRPDNTQDSYGDINSDGCPYPGRFNNTDFGMNSTPTAFYWNNSECGIEINKIRKGQDGTILLENNSINTNDQTTERQKLFFEGFENETIRICVDDNGFLNPKWHVEENTTTPMKIIEKPYAYSGKRSLQLSAKRGQAQVNSILNFEFNLPNTEGILRAKIYINSLNPQSGNPNIVKMGYYTNGSSDMQYVELQSSENDEWNLSVVELPEDIIPKITIEGTAFSGSILAIDNIEIEQIVKNEEARIGRLVSTDRPTNDIYTLTGIKVSLSEAQANPGFYIHNGKKIIIRR